MRHFTHRLRRAAAASVMGAALFFSAAGQALAVTSIGTDISTDGNLTANGNVILGNALTDAITITGNVAISDTNWSISAAGVFTGDGSGLTNLGAATIGDGSITAKKLQAAAADLGAADVNIDLGNTNGAFNTNLTIDGTMTANALLSMTSLAVRDQSAAFNVLLAFDSSPSLTADRTLLADMGNADRNVTLYGNLSLTGDFATSGDDSVTLLTSGATSLTLPTTGTLATLAGAEVLTNKTLRNGVIIDRAGVDDDRFAFDVLPGGANQFTGSFTNLVDLDANRTYEVPNDDGILALGTLSNPLFFTTTGATNVTLPTSGTLTALVNGETLDTATNSIFTFSRNDAGTVTLTSNDGTAATALALLPKGAAGLTLGGVSTTALTVTTDSTGDAEVLFPDESIGSAEITNGTIVNGDLASGSFTNITSVGTLTALTLSGTLTLSGVATDVTTISNEDLTLSPNGTGRIILDKRVVDSNFGLSIADDTVGASPAVATLSPVTSYSEVACDDPDGCDLTLGEVGAFQGMQFTIVNNSVNTLNFADTAGVSELAGAFAAGQYDSITLRYMFDRWVETARSNN